MLLTNHRQGEDREYAEILNKFRVGEVTENDLGKLQQRVRPLGHEDIPSKALVVTCKNSAVNAINEDVWTVDTTTISC